MAGKDDVNGLNESPYEKVGKSAFSAMVSYKNCLNESPYEKVGKFPQWRHLQRRSPERLNESPYEKVGK